MPIVMMADGDRTIAAVHCDLCHQRIATADDGNVEWTRVAKASPGHQPETAPLFFTHKHCSDAFAAAHPEVDQSYELRLFPLRLGAALAIDHESAVESATQLAGLT